MAASFSVRRRASSSRKSCKNITHRRCPGASEPDASGAVSQVRTCRPMGLWVSLIRLMSATCGAFCRKLRLASDASACQAGRACNRNGGLRLAWEPSIIRAAGLAVRTSNASSTTSTPSVRFWITSSLTWLCTRAVAWLLWAICCSRTRRSASCCTMNATMKSPVPVSAACNERCVASLPLGSPNHQAHASSSSVTAAVVPIASVSVPSTEAMRMGSPNKGVKLMLPLCRSCRAQTKARSTPMEGSQCTPVSGEGAALPETRRTAMVAPRYKTHTRTTASSAFWLSI